MYLLTMSLGLMIHTVRGLYTDYFPPAVEGVTVLLSRQDSNITLSYKKTEVCEDSYAGFVHLPATALTDVEGAPDYPMNMFYWFFPARETPETALLAIWIGGGPGEAALEGAMTENGPCHIAKDGNSTISNPYSRNNKVNMLYIDQPVGAGYSYTTLQNVTYSQLDGAFTPTDYSGGSPYTPNMTVFPGTVSNQDITFQPNNSNIAAKAMWHFAQTWFTEFPIYRPEKDKISIWTNSYGGYYGPAIFRWWQQQNEKIDAGTLEAHSLHLDTLGIENGCIDAVSQIHSWSTYAYNNTYDLQMINCSVYEDFNNLLDAPITGCVALIQACRTLALEGDPGFYANNDTVNGVCSQIAEKCFNILTITSDYADRSVFDIAQMGTQRFPGYQHIAFFNQPWVQRSLGVPVNFTDNSNSMASQYFVGTSDPFRQNQSSIESLLGNGVQVALVYGDRDSRCNWIGAENVSLTLDYPSARDFRSAGYANISTDDNFVGGVVRQYDGFSFSRVFEAGHAVSAYQPETASKIFERVMFRRDVATGSRFAGSFLNRWSGRWRPRRLNNISEISRGQHPGLVGHYQSKGPETSQHIKNKLPPDYPLACNIWAVAVTCTSDQIAALRNGTAVVKDNIVVFPTT